MALASSALSPNSVSKPCWNPLKFSGTELPAELLIMVKSLALVVLLTNHARILPDPWLPFSAVCTRNRSNSSCSLSANSPVCVFNRRSGVDVQPPGPPGVTGAGIDDAARSRIVEGLLYYGNNKTFCGLIFFLTGLSTAGTPPFLRWQLGITYFGSGLNKLLDGDWHSGVFFENWAVNRLHYSWYITLDSLLPPMALARLFCWTTIINELGIVPCIVPLGLNYWAICANILFQSGLLLFTGTTFTWMCCICGM